MSGCGAVALAPFQIRFHDAGADRQLVGRIPLRRMQTVSDVPDVVSFLLSPAAGYVTGQALNACGGLEFD